MKLAQINLSRGVFIAGIGNTVKLENVEVEGTSIAIGPPPGGARMPVHGLIVVTPTAKVIIPWDRIDSIVTEWIKVAEPPVPPLPTTKEMFAAGVKELPQGRYAAGQGGAIAQVQGQGKASAQAAQQQQSASTQAAMQPPPPAKKGGRR